MTAPRKAPCVDVRTDVHKDVRFEVLGELAGYNRYEALGRLHALWSWCVDRGLQDAPEDSDGYVVSDAVVRRFLGPNGITAILGDGCDEFALGERRADGRIYLRGTSEYVSDRRSRAVVASAGGQARAASAPPREQGRFVSTPTIDQPEHQQPASNPPAVEPAATQPTPASSPSPSPSPSEIQNTLTPRAIGGDGRFQRHKAWWACMLAAHDRLRKPTAKRAAIKPNTPDLAKHPNERQLAECERFLREGGYDDAGIDAKMRHVVLVYEAEAERLETLDYFKPAIIWDTTRADRFPRKVDTSLEEARGDVTRASRAGPRRAGDLIGSATPRTDHPEGDRLLDFSEFNR
jgi:hypothetical protein